MLSPPFNRKRGDYVASHAKKSWGVPEKEGEEKLGVPEKEASDDCAYPSFEGRIEKLARAIAPPATHS